mmetsp:Transcript_14163/g.48817  ORF Transcript_14163/g.48817 Transcript_14163/m.48817 type:complete len:566 (-) Transcript_14163:977-2674(-)
MSATSCRYASTWREYEARASSSWVLSTVSEALAPSRSRLASASALVSSAVFRSIAVCSALITSMRSRSGFALAITAPRRDASSLSRSRSAFTEVLSSSSAPTCLRRSASTFCAASFSSRRPLRSTCSSWFSSFSRASRSPSSSRFCRSFSRASSLAAISFSRASSAALLSFSCSSSVVVTLSFSSRSPFVLWYSFSASSRSDVSLRTPSSLSCFSLDISAFRLRSSSRRSASSVATFSSRSRSRPATASSRSFSSLPTASAFSRAASLTLLSRSLVISDTAWSLSRASSPSEYSFSRLRSPSLRSSSAFAAASWFCSLSLSSAVSSALPFFSAARASSRSLYWSFSVSALASSSPCSWFELASATSRSRTCDSSSSTRCSRSNAFFSASAIAVLWSTWKSTSAFCTSSLSSSERISADCSSSFSLSSVASAPCTRCSRSSSALFSASRSAFSSRSCTILPSSSCTFATCSASASGSPSAGTPPSCSRIAARSSCSCSSRTLARSTSPLCLSWFTHGKLSTRRSIADTCSVFALCSHSPILRCASAIVAQSPPRASDRSLVSTLSP